MSWRVVGSGSVPGQYMWDLWWTKWHWDMFLSEYFVFPSYYHSTNTPYAFNHLSRTLYTQPVFYARLYYAFSLSAHYQFTPLLKLRPMVFALTFFGWFTSVYISLFSYVNMIYDLRPLFQEHNYGVTQDLDIRIFSEIYNVVKQHRIMLCDF